MGKVNKKNTAPVNDKSVDEIEKDLQLPSSSEEELSEDSADSGDEVDGLSSEEESDNEEEQEESESKSAKAPKVQGHSVNKVIKSASSSKASSKQKRGIIYIGRLPHGFYESELQKYFSQFGNIVNLKLSRNKKTGKSKHYAFIEFDNYEIAKIASETMDNYLLFGHLLKCNVIDESSAHSSLFDNQGKFKIIPWKKISKNKNDKPKSKEQWTKLLKKHESLKKAKEAELKSKGIDFDLSHI